MPIVSKPEVAESYHTPVLGLSLLNGFILLARRRRTIVTFLAVALASGLLAVFLIPSYYTATMSFLPPQQSASSASSMLAQLGGLSSLGSMAGSSLGLKNSADLYVGLLQSETVEDNVIQRFSLMADYRSPRLSSARKALADHTTIDGKQKDGIVRVSVTDRSPVRAAAVANGYAEQLQKISGTLAVTEAAQRRLFLEQQLQETKIRLTSAEEALNKTEQSTGVIQVEGQARALIESAAGLRAQVAAKEVQVQSMRTYAGQGNPDLIQAEQELSGLREQLAKLNGTTGSHAGSAGSEKGQLASSGLEYTRRLREAKYQETMFEILARQYEAAKLDEAREGALIQVVDRATVPDYRAGPKRLLVLLGCIFGGLIAAVIYVLLSEAWSVLSGLPEYRARLVSLRRTLGMRVVGH
jgi:uncharacterized protein involved in exopolysaccharide biosynthesis